MELVLQIIIVHLQPQQQVDMLYLQVNILLVLVLIGF